WGCQGGNLDPGPGTAAHLSVETGGGQSGTVGQPLGDMIVVQVTDDADRPVAGVTVTFGAAATAGRFTPAQGLTDARGEARARWTLGTHSGLASGSIAVDGLSPVAVSATALPGPAARLAFEVSPEVAFAGSVFAPPVVVAIRDEFDNVVPGASAEIAIGVNKGVLAGTSIETAVDGQAIFADLHLDEAGEGFMLTATAAGLAPATSGTFSVSAGSAARLRLVAGNGQRAPVGTAVAIAPEVVVRDTKGNGIPGVSVTFAVTGGGGTVTPAVVTTGPDGRAAPAAWTLGTVPGENALRASAAALPGAAIDFTAEADPGAVDPARSTVSAAPASIFTGATSVITVTVKDGFDNPVPGAAVRLSASGAGNTLVQPTATDGNGQASGSLRCTTAGTQTVTAEAGGVVVVQVATILVESPPAVATVTVQPGQVGLLVGQNRVLAADALDDQGRPVPGATVAWASDDAGVASVDANGRVTARSPGAATITATSGGHSGTAGITVSFGEGTLIGLTYCTIGGVADKMDVYVPAASKARPLPVAVQVHGGGWVSGSRSTGTQFTDMKQTLLDRGYLVVSLDYRLAPAHKYPSQIEDVKCAIRHLRSKASRYGLDPDRIGAWGGSAGGQLVALLGTADAGAGFDDAGGFPGVSSRVQAVIAQSAITDFTHPDELRDDYSREFLTWPDPTSPEMIEASPVTHVSAGDAPFFFIVGADDPLVLPAQSERMDQRLRAAGVTSSLLTVLHAGHNLEPTTGPTDPSAATIVARMAAFFDQELR
ncbi:MAG: Ig-like domain-containing protein, partial [Gemmatimonadales bacterium]